MPTVEKTWIRKGPASEDFEAVDVLPRITDEAVQFIDAPAPSDSQPFFLYLPADRPAHADRADRGVPGQERHQPVRATS